VPRKGKRKQNTDTPGVWEAKKVGRRVFRWLDPRTGSLKEKDCARQGCTNPTKRKAWRKKKSEALRQLRQDLEHGVASTESATPSAAVERYLGTLQHPRTRVSRRLALSTFAEWCAAEGIRDIADLGRVKLMEYRDQFMRQTDRQLSTKNQWLTVLGGFLRWARKRGLAPALHLDAIKDGTEKVPEAEKAIVFLQPREVRAVLEAGLDYDKKQMGPRETAPFLLTLLLTGCRFAEVAELPWSEVDLEAARVRLESGRVKTRRSRDVTMRESPSLLDLLRAMRERDPDGTHVFDWPSSSWSGVRCVLESMAGVHFEARTLRRTCSTVLVNATAMHGDASAWKASKRSGHSVSMLEDRYGGLMDVPEDAKTIESALGIWDLAKSIVEQVRRAGQ
jgi:integrase